VEPILKKSVKALLEQQDRHGCWSFPAHLGSHYISLYALFLEWLRFRGFSSRLGLNRLATILVETQLADGSWKQARDPAISSGDINATVLNYAALKFFKTSISAGQRHHHHCQNSVQYACAGSALMHSAGTNLESL
jgi:hypothetical protein